ncbi:hypothetical protein Pan258_06070 [Symmachiella dynata]|uniref:hypothetical protein n=1 Tax=Symmachiella dynata TaxID=2527995 RepID=UPI00118C5F1E|nr:hypothetical protein [Symmachiella dynata]QDT46588.1 hypothetical protein Pan258_06070 [Symmachiella dynata]
MSVRISCTHCRKRYQVPDHFLGRQATCKNCKKRFTAAAIAIEPDEVHDAANELAELPRRPRTRRDLSPTPAVESDASEVKNQHKKQRAAIPKWILFVAAGVLGLIFVGIFVVMSGIFLVTREVQRTASSFDNLNQISARLRKREKIFMNFPPASAQHPNHEGHYHSWRVVSLPYIKHSDPVEAKKIETFYSKYNFDEPWDSEQNLKLLPMMPDFYAAPGADPESGMTPYLAIAGLKTVIRSLKLPHPNGYNGTKIVNIRGGTAHTIMVVESKKTVPWTKPEDIPFDPSEPFNYEDWFKPEGFFALFADGTPRYLHAELFQNKKNKSLLTAMFKINGDEKIRFIDNVPTIVEDTFRK